MACQWINAPLASRAKSLSLPYPRDAVAGAAVSLSAGKIKFTGVGDVCLHLIGERENITKRR